jgi:hypothetical protein
MRRADSILVDHGTVRPRLDCPALGEKPARYRFWFGLRGDGLIISLKDARGAIIR